jgi:tetratricopeptide (TPR) repeat protein
LSGTQSIFDCEHPYRRYAEQIHQISLQAGDRSRQADAWLVLGRAQEGLGHLMQAAMAYQDALALYEELGRTHMTPEPRAGLARLALANGNLSEALAQVEGILSVLAQYPRAGLDKPLPIYLTCYRVLEANQDPRAASVLKAASALLDESASHFTEEFQRQAFLNNVPSHRELMQAHDRLDVGKDYL